MELQVTNTSFARPGSVRAALAVSTLSLGCASHALASVVSATADTSNNLNAYGAAVQFNLQSGDSYAGIATKVTSGAGGSQPIYGTTAWLRGGVVGGSGAFVTVNMQWRAATTSETFGTSTVPPMPDSAGYNSLSADVLKLSGVRQTGPSVGGLTPTDAFALEMTYNPANLIQSYQFGSTMGWDLADIYASGEGQITYFSANAWSKEVVVVTPGANKVENYFGTYAQFAAANLLNDFSDLTSWVGSYGFTYVNADGIGGNADDYRMWVILDHNSVFGPTPAPGALAALGMAGLLGGSRRRRA